MVHPLFFQTFIRPNILKQEVDRTAVEKTLADALKELGLPEGYKAVVEAHREALNVYRQSNRNWTYFSPAHLTMPGERTGRFRLGRNEIVTGADGQSRISCEDYAMALLDEVELPRHVQQRFTIGY